MAAMVVLVGRAWEPRAAMTLAPCTCTYTRTSAARSSASAGDQTGVQGRSQARRCPLADDKKEEAVPAAPVSPMVLAYTVKDIDGKDVDLASFKGQVVLIVNVASNCGYTPQYTGLQKLYTDKKDKGLVILGFPANNFGEQEPGSESEIKSFCTGKYNVTFPMFSKVSVKGDDQHPLYKQLALQAKPIGGDPAGTSPSS